MIAKEVSLGLERELQPYARVRVLIDKARCDPMDLKIVKHQEQMILCFMKTQMIAKTADSEAEVAQKRGACGVRVLIATNSCFLAILEWG